jgi:hypothetical protein
MVHLRSGKNTNVYESRAHECGHMCASSMIYCCACNDIRPVQATYIAHNKSYLSQGSYVSRNHYYCPACKATAPPPARSHRQPLAERPPPEPVKIDFSKMKSKPASDPALFRPSPKLTPEDRVEILKNLNRELRKMYETSENTVNELRSRIKLLEAEINYVTDANHEYVKRLSFLTERITNPSM